MSFLFGLILGCVIGALGYYSIQNYSRQEKEEVACTRQEDMTSLFNEFPQLMQNMLNALSTPENQNIREFFVVDKWAIMSSAIPRLRFDLSEEMLHWVARLEEWGCIEQLEHDSLLYKIEEDFVEDLMAHQKDQALNSLS